MGGLVVECVRARSYVRAWFGRLDEDYAAMPILGCVGRNVDGMIWDVGCGSPGAGTALFCLALMKTIAPIKITIIAIANITTTGRNEESPLRLSGVGSLLEGSGSLMLPWMLPCLLMG